MDECKWTFSVSSQEQIFNKKQTIYSGYSIKWMQMYMNRKVEYKWTFDYKWTLSVRGAKEQIFNKSRRFISNVSYGKNVNDCETNVPM